MKKLLLRLLSVGSLIASVATAQTAIPISRGGDLLRATATIHLNLPQDFFAGGSAPYVGDVQATGVQIGTVGPYEVGNASMILERRSTLGHPGGRIA